MLRGSSFHTIDAKGRIIVPARFREVLKERGSQNLMMTRMDGALVAYPMDEWLKIEKRILSLAEKSASMRRFRRVFIGGAFDCALDKQDRTLIPPALRQYAQLEREIVMVGVLDHFEIWSKDLWDRENQSLEADLQKEDVRNEIAQLGL
jgi:MraZ protein